MLRFTATTAAVAALAATPLAQAQTVFTANGNAAGITATVDSFRNALGALNPNQPVNFAGGRREINWDAVPDARADPNLFPGSFFNGSVSPRARGISFSTPGTGFLVSANAGAGAPVAFGFANDFVPFSAQRMFSSLGSTITDVRFFSPLDQTTVATTQGFGAVFEDVEVAGLTRLEYYGLGNQLLATVLVPEGASGGLSFGGAMFASSVVARVRIFSGDAPLLGNGVLGAGRDSVVMDDFIYGEMKAVPEPATWALMLGGLAGIAGLAQRRRRSGQATAA